MGYVCTVAGGKGGAGKTTVVVNAGVALQTRGHDVVAVDADLGMANLGPALGLDPERTVHDVLAGETTVSEVLIDGPGGLSVVPGEASLSAFADADPARLRRVIETLRGAYDVVLVDTGAGLSHEVAVPLGLADGVALVATPDEVAVADAVKTAALADRVGGPVAGGVLGRVARSSDVDAADGRLDPLLGVIPEDGRVVDGPLVVDTGDGERAGGPAAAAFRALAENLERLVEGADPADLSPTVDERWFGPVDGGADEPDGGTKPEGAEESDGGRSGVFGLFD